MPADAPCKRVSNRSREAGWHPGGRTEEELEKFVQGFPIANARWVIVADTPLRAWEHICAMAIAPGGVFRLFDFR